MKNPKKKKNIKKNISWEVYSLLSQRYRFPYGVLDMRQNPRKLTSCQYGPQYPPQHPTILYGKKST